MRSIRYYMYHSAPCMICLLLCIFCRFQNFNQSEEGDANFYSWIPYSTRDIRKRLSQPLSSFVLFQEWSETRSYKRESAKMLSHRFRCNNSTQCEMKLWCACGDKERILLVQLATACGRFPYWRERLNMSLVYYVALHVHSLYCNTVDMYTIHVDYQIIMFQFYSPRSWLHRMVIQH